MTNSKNAQKTTAKKSKFKMPHIFIILFAFIVIMSLMTYIIPAGEYDRVEGPDGRMVIDATTYEEVEQNPVGLLDIFVAIPQGFVEAGWIIVLVFCVAGAFDIIGKTGAIVTGVNVLARKMSKRGILIIPVLMAMFAIVDAFIGMPELCLVYVVIVLPLVRGLGFDSMTAVAVVLLGSAAGFVAALTNPFTIGVAQKVAGLPLYSGIGFRVVTLITFLTIVILYVMRYAKKVRDNPQLSLTYEMDQASKDSLQPSDEIIVATQRQKLVGLAVGIMFFMIVIGVLKFGWDMPEMGGMFIAMGIVSGLLGGLSGQEISEAFVNGCKDVMVGAIVIGIARGVSVVMNQGMIMDTIVFAIGQLIQGLPGSITAVGMFLVQSLLNFLVPSGSGQALVTMPIMAPLADIVGVTRQTAVLAFQFGDGWSNIIFPTSGYFMATLAIAKVSWDKWIKSMFSLFLIVSGVSVIFLVIAHAIQWGPF